MADDNSPQEVKGPDELRDRVERAQEGRDRALDLAVVYMDVLTEILKGIPVPTPQCDHEERDPDCVLCFYRYVIGVVRHRLDS